MPITDPFQIPWAAAFWAEDPAVTAPANGAVLPSSWNQPGTYTTGEWVRVGSPTFISSWKSGRPAVNFAQGQRLTAAYGAGSGIAVTVAIVGETSNVESDLTDNIATTDSRLVLDRVGGIWRMYRGNNLTAASGDALPHLFIARFLNDTGDGLTIDGTAVISGTACGNINQHADIGLGSSPSNTDHVLCKIAFAGVITGELTTQQRTDLLDWYNTHYGTPPTNLVIANLTSGTALDAPVLSTPGILTINNLASATTLESPTLGTAATLVIANLSSTAPLDSVVLAMGYEGTTTVTHWHAASTYTPPDGDFWTGSAFEFPGAAYHNNARAADQGRWTYAAADHRPTWCYTGPWADGLDIELVAGTAMKIIEWQRGTDVWRETIYNTIGARHVVDLHTNPLHNCLLIERDDIPTGQVSVRLRNFNPVLLVPYTLTLTPGNTQIAATWTGEYPSYQVRIDGGTWIDKGAATSHTFTGLTNGVFSDIEVRTTSTLGVSAPLLRSAEAGTAVPLVINTLTSGAVLDPVTLVTSGPLTIGDLTSTTALDPVVLTTGVQITRIGGSVATTTPSTNEASHTFTFTTPTVGSLMVIHASAYLAAATTLTIADNQGHTWTPIVAELANSGENLIRLRGWTARNTTTTTTVVTVTANLGTYFAIVGCEYTGVDTAVPLDGITPVTTQNGSDNTPTSGAVTPATSNARVVSVMAWNQPVAGNPTVTPEAGWTQIAESEAWDNTMVISAVEKQLTTAVAESHDWTFTGPGTATPIEATTYTFALRQDVPAVVDTLTIANLISPATLDTISLSSGPATLTIADLTTVSALQAVTLSVPITGRHPVAVSANGRYLVDQVGDPWFGVGDTAWSLPGALTTAEITQYLENRAAKGINLVVWSCPEAYYTKQTPEWINRYGQAPFTGTHFQSPINEAYWLINDHAVNECLRLGITAMICPFYSGYAAIDGWVEDTVAATNAQMTAYCTTVSARYAGYPNIVWLIGHDMVPSSPWIDRAIAGAAALRAGDSHLLTLGGNQGGIMSTQWGGAIAHDFDLIYDYTLEPALWSQNCWNLAAVPVCWFEGVYEGEQSASNQYNDEPFLRAQMWGPLTGGAALVFLGNNPIWHYDSPHFFYPYSNIGGWVAAMEAPGSLRLAAFATFIEQLYGAWSRMVPDTTDTFLTAGEGSSQTRAAARFDTVSTSGVVAMAYVPHGGSTSLTFDLNELASDEVIVAKVDPSNLATTTLGTYATVGSQTFGSLGTNSSGDGDWALTFQAVLTSLVRIGGAAVDAVNLGTSTVTKIYAGTSQVWP